jgi:hypothetical protein
LTDLIHWSANRSSRPCWRVELRNLGHHVEGVLGGGPACAEFQRARVDDLTSSLPMKDGQPVKRGCWGGEHPTARGSRRRWGVARRSPSLVLQSGAALRASTLPLVARGPARAARPGGASRRLRRWGEGGERRRGAGVLLRSSAKSCSRTTFRRPGSSLVRRTAPELRGERLGKCRGPLHAHVFSLCLCPERSHPRSASAQTAIIHEDNGRESVSSATEPNGLGRPQRNRSPEGTESAADSERDLLVPEEHV